MIIRKNFLPRGLNDIAATSFVTFIIPVIYVFEINVVLPEVCGNGQTFFLHASIGTFFLFNIVSNFLATILCDTSIRSLVLIPSGESNVIPMGWHMCAECEAVVPPRAWHCKQCRSCILKRDHHCIFTGNCVGHKNHRYFMMFLLYLFISCIYATIFNTYFVWFLYREQFFSLITLIKMLFPFLLIMYEQTSYHAYLLFYIITVIAAVFTGVLFFYHLNLIKKGRTIHEKTRDYDVGVAGNLKMVFGKRWYLTWISPFMDSPLSHNGIHFENIQNVIKVE